MEVVMNGQDLEMGSDAWIAGSAGLELSLRPMRVGPVQSFVHFGPMRGLLLDASTLDVTWGAGLAYGAGVIIGHGGVNVLIDARGEEQFYMGMEGSATGGACSVKAVSVGLHFGR
jgi:hypothetical protein